MGIGHLLAQTITIAPNTGLDLYGKRTFGSPVTYICRISGKVKLIRTDQGLAQVSERTIYIDPPPPDKPIGLQDLLTLSDGTTPLIMSVQTAYARDGSPFYVAIETVSG